MRSLAVITFVVAGGASLAWFLLPRGFSYLNYLRIRAGMSLNDVNTLLGRPGSEIRRSEVTQVVDWSEPLDSPKRLRPTIDGEKFYKWKEFPDGVFGGAYIIISTVGDKVNQKEYWAPSL
jgi:hypothetical protein